MTLISLQFAVFVCVTAVVYFLFPEKYRWTVLLAASYYYYLTCCNVYVIYMLITTLTTWFGGLLIAHIYEEQDRTVKEHKQDWTREERKQYKEKMLKKSRSVMITDLVLNFGILAVLKYSAPAVSIAQNIADFCKMGIALPSPGFLLPLGISFYTFQAMGYLIDVYQEKVDAQKNLAKFALFVSFFPQIIQGPIAMYDDLAKQLYEAHSFRFDNLKNGALLILWGVFKKLIVAERAVKFITVITDESDLFPGAFILAAVLMYALQLYADFSGGIDIVRGVAEIFDIHMAENFRRPYFAMTLTEYWHRWHITLGNWVRAYVFYPLSLSKTFLNMGRKLTKKCGKHIGKVVPTSLASVITFLIIGIWHGANGKYVAFGLWNGLAIMAMELMHPVTVRVEEKLHVKRESMGYRLVAMAWTFVLVLIGYYFDIARNTADALSMMVRSAFRFHLGDIIHNMHMVQAAGLGLADYIVIVAGALVMLVASVIQEKSGKQIRELLCERPMIVQWAVIWAGLFAVVIFGYYGPNIDPSAFVYMQF